MSRARELAELGAVYNSGALSNRNVIINGNMEIAQRGTSQTSAGFGTLDRFNLSLSGASATMTQESFTIGQTDVPGSYKYLKLAVSAGNNNSGVFYKIEAKDAIDLIGKKVTASYYAKGTSPAAGLQVAMEWYDGSSSSPSSSTTVTLTSSWVKYTHTFDVPSISGLTLTNAGAYLEIKWAQANADTGTGAYEVNLAQIQVELGTEATPFEHRSFGQELALCQRYFYKVQGSSSDRLGIGGYAVGATEARMDVVFPCSMRAAPTISGTGTAQFDANADSADWNCSALTIDEAPTGIVSSLGIQIGSTSGMTAGQSGGFRFRSTGTLSFSAEI